MSKRPLPTVVASERFIGEQKFWHYSCPYCKNPHAIEDGQPTPIAACSGHLRVRLVTE